MCVCVFVWCLLPGCAICLCVCAFSFFSFLTALPCKESLTTFFAANLCISVRVWVFVSMCVCVCCAYRSQPGRQLAIYDLLASLFGFGWCVIAAIGCFGLPPAPAPPPLTHTIHPCWLCAAQSVVVSCFIFHFNLNLFEIRERVSEKMFKFLFWPLPTSQRLNKKWQRAEQTTNNNTYIHRTRTCWRTRTTTCLSFYYSSLGHISCCCCFNTWHRRQRVELELIFFEFLLLRCHFPRSRLCVGVTSVCV